MNISDAELRRFDDGRQVWYSGQRVTSLADHPVLRRCIENRALEMALHDDPVYRDLFWTGSENGVPRCVVLSPPKSSDDLIRYRKALEVALDQVGGGVSDRFHFSWGNGLGLLFHTVGLVQGSMAGHVDPAYAANLTQYLRFCQDHHVSMTTAFSEARGDRRKPPWEQEQYLQVVKERDDGLVFRGMRRISTGAAYADELWVTVNPEVPRAAPPPDQVDKFNRLLFIVAMPLNAPGIKIICRPSEMTTQHRFDFPLSWYDEIDAMVVFEDVLVPWERVFSYRDHDFMKGYLATGTGVAEYAHCICAASKAEMVVGVAYLMAEANGDLGNPAVMTPISELVMYLELIRVCIKTAELEPESRMPTMMIPNRVALDVAVNTISAEYFRVLKVLRDLGGGSVTTNQNLDDLESPEIGSYVERVFAGAVSGRQRLAILNLIEDLSTSLFSARKEQYQTFSLGPPFAKKMALSNEYDFTRVADKVRGLLNL